MVSQYARANLLRFTLLSLLLATGAVALAERPPGPQLLPENTLVYARLADAQDTAEKFQATSLGRMLQDPQMKPFVGNLWGSATEAFAQVEDELDVSLDDLLRLPQGEAFIAVVGATEGPPAVVALLEVKDQLPTAQKLIDRALQEAENDGVSISTEMIDDQELTLLGGVGPQNRDAVLFVRDGAVVFCSDRGLAEQLLDVWDGEAETATLADNKKFTAIMSQSVGTKDERPQISWYVDPIGLFRNIGRGNLGAQTAIAFLAPLGLDGLEAVGGSIILAAEEFESISHMHVLLKNPRQAVLKMLALKSGDLDPEPWVPKDVIGYSSAYWDFDTTFSELAELYDVIRLQQGAFAELVRNRVSEQVGVDVQNEILPALAGRVTMITRIQRPVTLNSETVALAIQVKDGEQFTQILDKVVAKYSDSIERAAFGSTTYYRVKFDTPPDDGNELTRVPEPSFVLLGDYVIIADSSSLIEQCIMTKNSPGSSLADDLEFKLVASRLQRHSGGRQPCLIAFQRPEEQFRAWYELATADSTKEQLANAADNAFFGALDKALSENPLPPFAVIAQYLSPAGGIMINDETGIHYIAFSLKSE